MVKPWLDHLFMRGSMINREYIENGKNYKLKIFEAETNRQVIQLISKKIEPIKHVGRYHTSQYEITVQSDDIEQIIQDIRENLVLGKKYNIKLITQKEDKVVIGLYNNEEFIIVGSHIYDQVSQSFISDQSITDFLELEGHNYPIQELCSRDTHITIYCKTEEHDHETQQLNTILRHNPAQLATAQQWTRVELPRIHTTNIITNDDLDVHPAIDEDVDGDIDNQLIDENYAIPQIELNLTQTQIAPNTRRLTATWTQQLAEDIHEIYMNEGAEEELTQQLQQVIRTENQIAQQIGQTIRTEVDQDIEEQVQEALDIFRRRPNRLGIQDAQAVRDVNDVLFADDINEAAVDRADMDVLRNRYFNMNAQYTNNITTTDANIVRPTQLYRRESLDAIQPMLRQFEQELFLHVYNNDVAEAQNVINAIRDNINALKELLIRLNIR